MKIAIIVGAIILVFGFICLIYGISQAPKKPSTNED